MKRKTVKKLIFIPLGTFATLLAIAIGGAALVLTPKRLTPLVAGLCDRYLDAQVRFDTVSVSIFQDFPYITLRLRGTEIISHAFAALPDSVRRTLPAEADTLARIGRLDLSLNPWDLASGKADIRRVGLENARLYACVALGGRANWEIYQSDTTATDTTTSAFEVNVNRISIRGGLHLTYDSRPDRINGTVRLRNFHVRGRLTTDLLQNDIRRLRLRGLSAQLDMDGKAGGLTVDSLTIDGARRVDYKLAFSAKDIRWGGIHWLDSVQLRTGILFHGKDHQEVTVRDFGLRLNDMLLTAAGEAAFRGDSIETVFGVQTQTLPLAGLLHLIPVEVLPLARDYETNLTTDLDLRIEGIYNPAAGALPNVTADWRIPAGYLYHTKDLNGSRIDTLALDATLRFRPGHPDSTGIDLRQLKVAGIGLNLDAGGKIERLTGDPSFTGEVRGDLSLDYLTQHFPSPEGALFRGRIGMDMKGHARLSQLTPERIGSTKLGGHLTVDTLLVRLPKEDFRLMMGRGRLGMGTGLAESDSLIAKSTQAVGATFTVDTLDLGMREICVTGRKIKVHATTSAKNLARDTTAVHPSQGMLSATDLRVGMGDSTVFIGRRIVGRWSILPAADNPGVPRVALEIEARRLSLREAESRFVVRQGKVSLDATLYRPDNVLLQRRGYRLDSLQQLYPAVERDSLFAHVRALRGPTVQRQADEFAESDIDMRLSSDLSGLLRRWRVKGSVAAAVGRIVSPYFPLATSLRDIDIQFTTDEVHLNRTFIKAGESQAVLTGGLTGLRKAMLGGGRIRGDLKVEADTLNMNEIVRVLNAGSALVAQGGIGHTENDEQLEERIALSADTSSASTLLVIPGNIDMTFDMEVRHGAYANLRLDSLSGEIVARNRALQLSNLTMRSNAGDLRMTGLYSTRTRQDVQAGFDLEMEKMQVARLIGLIPSIDTLMPMLRSFDGVVNCQLAVTARIDSAMNILMPTVNAACHIAGDSLVLMDGETFTEISKMLMFKNKKRNLIDHISAEFLVRDSQIEVFPFVVEIDRYRAAVSGVHKMDMTFNYHISVLKSPIPFRLGVDIFGSLDDFDFKITRARYKTANLPTKVEVIETTRLNLRNYIRDVFLRGGRTGEVASLRITPDTQSPTELLPPADSLNAADTVALQAADAFSLME